MTNYNTNFTKLITTLTILITFTGMTSAAALNLAIDANDKPTKPGNTALGIKADLGSDGADVTLKFTDSNGDSDTKTLTEGGDADSTVEQDIDLTTLGMGGSIEDGTLTMEADQGASFSSAEDSATVEVDGTSPGFTNGGSNSANIDEDNTGQVVDVEAGDDGTSSPDTSVTYSLISGAGSDAADFSIDSSNGQITLDSTKDFENPGDDDSNNDYELSVTAEDDAGNTNTQSVTININDINDAPTMSTETRTLNSIGEDATSNSGTSISTILGSAGTTNDQDGDTRGVAVEGVTNTDGTWEYSTNGGSSWSAISSVSNTNALLLAENDHIRFVPNADFSGTSGGSVTLRAWDQTSGTAGNKIDVSSNGGSTAYSSSTAGAEITVQDAPEVSSITRSIPSSPTNSNSVDYTVTFSESVSSVTNSDFTATRVSGGVSGSVSSVSSNSGTTIDVTVNSITGDGELRLDLSDDDSITDGNSVPLGGVGISSNADGSYSSGEKFNIDNTAPSVSVTSPSDGTEYISQQSIDGSSSDGNTVSSVELKIKDSNGDTYTGSTFTNSETWVTASGTSTWSYDTGGNGINKEDTFDVTARATDNAGNTGSTSDPTVTYTVDTTAPGVSNVNIEDTTDTNDVVGDGDTIKITADVTDSNTISGVTADASSFGVGTVSLKNDGNGADADSTDNIFTKEITTSSPTEGGSQKVSVSATDAAGNGGSQNVDSSGSLEVDTTAPAISSVEVDSGKNKAKVTFSEPVGTNSDGTGSLTTSSDFTYSDGNSNNGATGFNGMSEADGSDNVVTINLDSATVSGDIGTDSIAAASTQIYDTAGNAVSDSANLQDTTKPSDPVSTSASTITSSNSGSYSVDVTLSDDHEAGDLQVKVDDGSTTATKTKTVSAETDGDSDNPTVTVSGIDVLSLAEGSGVDVTAKITDFGSKTNPSDHTATTTVTKDTTAPAISSATTKSKSTIDVTIDDATSNVDVSTISKDDFNVGGNAIDSISGFSSDSSPVTGTLTVKSGNEFGTGTTPNVEIVSGIDDTVGNTKSTQTYSSASVSDGVSPEVSSVDTFDSEPDGDVNGVKVTYSEDVNSVGTDEVSFNSYSIGGASETSPGVVEYTTSSQISGTGATPTISFTSANIQDTNGNNLASTNDKTASDNAAPVVNSASLATTPVTDSETGSSQNLDITFSESIATDPTVSITGLTSSYTLSKTSSSGSTWSGSVTFNDDNEENTGTIVIKDAEDSVTNKMSDDSSNTFFVDTKAPGFNSDYPKTSGATDTGFNVLTKQDENGGKAYYVVVSDGSGAPSATQVTNGQNSDGQSAIASESKSVSANSEETFSVSTLSENTNYDAYVVAEDSNGNLRVSSKVEESTTATAPTLSSATLKDTDTDGMIDTANLVFSEAMDESTFEASDWSIGSKTVDSVAVDGFGETDDSNADNKKIQLKLSEGNEVGGTSKVDVNYVKQGDNNTQDEAGVELAKIEDGDVSETDAASPVLMNAQIDTSDSDSTKTLINMEFSEGSLTISNDNGLALGSQNLEIDSYSTDTSTIEANIEEKGTDTNKVLQTGSTPTIPGDSSTDTSDLSNLFEDTSGNNALTASGNDVEINTFRENMEKGWNFVSFPIADSTTPQISEVMNTNKVEAIWRYQDGNWESYKPGTSNDFSTVKAGEGYLVKAKSQFTLAPNVNNEVGNSGVQESAPGQETYNEGWNLLGHFQEHDQTRSTAFANINSLGTVYGQSSQNGDLGLTATPTNAQAGHAYWVESTGDLSDGSSVFTAN